MKIFSWNVNGLRAALKKGFLEWLDSSSGDIVCLQETKVNEDTVPGELFELEDYTFHYHSANRKGYSGVGCFVKNSNMEVSNGFGIEEFDNEGRVQRIKAGDFLLYNVYFPNGQKDEGRLDYKLRFYEQFLKHIEEERNSGHKCIITGDFNTAHKPIDLANPKQNENYSGFMPVEREWIDRYLESGMIDVFRHYYPEKKDQYTWWSYRFNARKRNVGWRIDYFMVTEDLLLRIKNCIHHTDIEGSDHCPIELVID